MDEMIVSSAKLKELKSKFLYFNHIQEIGEDFENVNWELIPQEYRYFMNANRPYDTLAFYNWYYGYYIDDLENVPVNTIILDTLHSLDSKELTEFENKLKNNKDLWERLLKRNSATYRIDLAPNKKGIVTQSIMHVFSSSYENTELLFYLYWLCQALIGEPLTQKFDKYKNRYGEIKMGSLITDILKKLSTKSELKDFKSVVEKAYNRTLRHLTFHSSVSLDDESRLIVGIDDSNLKIPYTDFFTSMYSLQQLQNHLKMYVKVLLIDEQDIINEGIFTLTLVESEDAEKGLGLVQLHPFYSYDTGHKKRLSEVSIVKGKKHYIFQSDKELLRVDRYELLDEWFDSYEEEVLNVFSVQPDVFELKETDLVFNHDLFGDFIVVDEYEINKVTLTNKN